MARRRLGFWRRFAVIVVKPPLLLLTRRNWTGLQNIPKEGGAIIVANHVSHADPLVSAHFVYEAGRWPEFLAKRSMFEVPVLGWLLRRVRQIPVHRGTVDAAKALEAATRAVRAGDAVIIYPEGTTTKEPNLWPMKGKTGAARLALDTGAPVVPLVMWGPQQIFDPRTAKLRLRPRTPVTVVAGPPVDLTKWAGAQPTSATLYEMTEHIMQELRTRLAQIRGEPAPPLWSPAARRSATSTVDNQGSP